MSQTINSTFHKSAQGWTMSDGSPANWVASGGNPGGYFAWSDTNENTNYYAAPEKYLGGDRAFIGGTLSYDIIDSANDYSGEPDVELVGANGLTLVATLGQPGTDWTHFSIALDQTGGWHIGSLDGALASRLDIKAVLADVDQLLIRADYHAGLDETAGLDNVLMAKATVGALPPQSLTANLLDHLAGAPVHLDHGHMAIV